MNSVAVQNISTLGDFALHGYGTGEKLPLGMPIFQAAGNPTERYRITLGFYGTGDSTAWILSSEQFREFLQIQALSQLSPSLLQLLIPRGTIGTEEEGNPRRNLLRRILARRDAIEAVKGVLPESYPLVREDRER
jgi:hypothetical protein